MADVKLFHYVAGKRPEPTSASRRFHAKKGRQKLVWLIILQLFVCDFRINKRCFTQICGQLQELGGGGLREMARSFTGTQRFDADSC